jgi:hypothetical protein
MDKAMPIDVTKLETRIKRLQKLKELLADPDACDALADPEIMSAFREALGLNGRQHVLLGTEREGTSVETSLPPEGSQVRAVYDAAKTLHGSFDIKTLKEAMVNNGHKFTAQDPMVALWSALRSLKNKKLVRVIHKGSGKNPDIYVMRD